MEPVTVADQPAVLDPADADELIGTLLHAATVIGALAGDPAAGDALDGCPCPAEHDVTALWWDLQLAADDLSQATTGPAFLATGEKHPGQNAANARNSATRRNRNRKR